MSQHASLRVGGKIRKKRNVMPLLLKNQATMNDGATPNETTSDNESSSPPIGDFASRVRAAKPSKKSKTAAPKIIAEAHKTWSWHKKSIDTQPLNRLQHVMVFGMCFLIDITIKFLQI